MNFLEYLNKTLVKQNDSSKSVSDKSNKQTEKSSTESKQEDSIFASNSKSANINDNIFKNASLEDLDEVDYEKILNEDIDSTDSDVSNLEYALKELFSFDKIKDVADANNDGELSIDEAKNYIQELIKKDGIDENLSIEDFNILMEEVGMDLQAELDDIEKTAEESAILDEKEENISSNDTTKDTNTPIQQTGASQGSGATQSYGGGGGSYSYNNSAGSASQQAQKSDVSGNSLDSMDLEQLQAEKTNREGTLKDKQELLTAVQNGTNENVKAAIDEREEAKKAYEDALQQDEQFKEISEKIIENDNAIEQNEQELDENAQAITDKNNEVTQIDSTIQSLRSALSALKSSLDALPAPTGKEEDKDKDAKIQAQKQKIEKEIQAKKNEISKQNEKLNEARNALKDLHIKKGNLATEKTKLLKQKAEYDELINNSDNEELKQALENYNNAQAKVESVKQSELSTAQSAVNDAQKSVDEINEKINVAQANKIKSENAMTPTMDINNIPKNDIDKWGVTEKTLPDGTKVLACSWSRFANCQPEWLEKQQYLLQAAEDLGLTLLYSDVERTVAESNAGHAKKGNIVVAGGQSPHNYGTAVDIVLYKDGQAVGVDSQLQTDFATKVKQYSNNTVTWGGDWTKKGERHHFELSDWQKYKSSQYLVG